MSNKYYNYRLYCNTASKFENVILDSNLSPPTKCPSDTNHTIDASSITIVDIIEKKSVILVEESVKTGGNFTTMTVGFNAQANTTTSEILRFPFNVSPLALFFSSVEANRGDKVFVEVGKNSTIGILTQPITQIKTNIETWNNTTNYTVGMIVKFSLFNTDRYYTCIKNTTNNQLPTEKLFWQHGYELSVSPTVIQYIMNGYYINLFDGINTNELNRIVFFNKLTNKLYTENAPDNTFNINSYIRFTVRVVEPVEISNPGMTSIGLSKIGGNSVPADVAININYINNGIDIKRFVGRVEYLY